MVRAGERRSGVPERPVPAEQMDLDAFGSEARLPVGGAGRAGDRPTLGDQPAGQRQRGVAQPKQNRRGIRRAPRAAPRGPRDRVRPRGAAHMPPWHRVPAGAAPRPPWRAPVATGRRAWPRPAGKARLPAVADRDQDVAHEPIASGALDRRAGKAAPEGVVQLDELRERRRAQIVARLQLVSLAVGRTCSRGRPRDSRRSRRCDCPSGRGTPAVCAPGARS